MSILGRFANLIWFLFNWFLLVAVGCAALIGFYLYQRADERVRAYAEQVIGALYPELDVHVESAHLVEREGFRLTQISLKRKHADNSELELAHLEEVLFKCRPTLEDLLGGHVEITEVILRQPTLRATRQRNGRWNLAGLDRWPAVGSRLPPLVRVEDATLEVMDASRQPTGFFVIRDVRLSVQPEHEAAVEGTRSHRFRVEGSFTGDHFQRGTLRGVVEPQQGAWHVQGQLADLTISKELQSAVPVELGHRLEVLGDLHAHCGLTFDVWRDHRASSVRSSGNGILTDGRLTEAGLSLPLNDISASFAWGDGRLRVDDATGRYGEACIRLQCMCDGTAVDSPAVVRGAVDHIRLDRNYLSGFPREWQDCWQRLQPQGLASVNFEVVRADGAWRPQVEIRCHDVGLQWERLPYPVEAMEGDVQIRGDDVTFNLSSRLARQPLRIKGQIRHPGPDWTGWFEARTDSPMVVDERLVEALPERARRIVRSLAAHGQVTFECRHQRDDPTQPTRHELHTQVTRGSVTYDGFPYPLHNVTANIDYVNGIWTFRDAVGFNDTCRVTCFGQYQPQARQDALRLRFMATNVGLEAELRDALPPTTQGIWRSLAPEGTIDRVVADVRYSPASRQRQISVEMAQHDPRNDSAERTNKLSMRMKELPLRVDSITGSAVYENGHLRFRKVRGQHEGVALAADGEVAVAADGSWGLHLSHFSVDRAHLGATILQALPGALARLIDRMQIQGAISLDGECSISGKSGVAASRNGAWRVLMDVDDASAHLGSRCEHINGLIRLAGESRADEFGCRGELDIDSLIIEGAQATSIKGPIWLDNQRAVAGEWIADAGNGSPSRPIEAHVLGGTVRSSFQVANSDDGAFEAHLRLMDADLAQIKLLHPRASVDVRGHTWADMTLTGNRQGKHTYQGSGKVYLRNTNLYELPLFLALFKTMRTGSTDRTAFTASDAKFRLQGTHLYLDQLDLIGDTLTLKGVGEISLDRKLNLDFYSVMGREDAYLPAIRPLLGMASRRFLLVKVTGTLDDPRMTREVLPGLNDTLKSLFPEESKETTTSTLVQHRSTPAGSSVQPVSAESAMETPTSGPVP